MVSIIISIILISGVHEKIMKARIYYKDDAERMEILKRHPDILTGSAKEKYFEVFLNQKEYDEFKNLGIKIEIQIPDVEKYLKEKYGYHVLIDFGEYYTFSEMQQEMNQIASQYPNITKLCTLGLSWYNKPILMMKISDNPNSNENEPKGLFTGVHHAREPIGTSICMDFIRWLCQKYNQNDTATFLVNEREIYIVPVVNPDGYVYNEQDPWGNWRKNQRDNNNNGQFDSNYDGVDLNRNYGYMWGYDNNGSSPNPPDETYRGPSAFSEPETQAIKNLCLMRPPQVAINFHSYGNYIITPWGYINAYPPEPDKTIYLAMADTMNNWNGYTYGNAYQTVGYVANGTSDDWMYGEQNQKPKCFAYTFEVGNDFWEATNDTNLIIQRINQTRPCMIYLLYKAQNFVDIKEKIDFSKEREDKFIISYKEFLKIENVYNLEGRKIKDARKAGIYILKEKEENKKIIYIK